MKLKTQLIGIFLLFLLQLQTGYSALQYGNPNGQTNSSLSAPVVISTDAGVQQMIAGIVAPATTFNLITSGVGIANSVTAQVQPGATISFCVATPTLSQAAYTVAVTETAGNATVTAAATGATAVGDFMVQVLYLVPMSSLLLLIPVLHYHYLLLALVHRLLLLLVVLSQLYLKVHLMLLTPIIPQLTLYLRLSHHYRESLTKLIPMVYGLTPYQLGRIMCVSACLLSPTCPMVLTAGLTLTQLINPSTYHMLQV